MTTEIGMLDLFAGTGVGVAAKWLGIREYGVEIMPAAIASREAAGFETPYYDAWEIEKASGLDFDILWASPPCQTFSVAGKGAGRKALDDVLRGVSEKRWLAIDNLRALGREVGDDRTALVLTPLAYTHRYQPTFVALEQVPAVLPVWESFVSHLEEMGYSTWTGILNAADYGVPQTRKRAYLIARRDGHEARKPTATHSEGGVGGLLPWVSMYEALGGHIGQVQVSNYSSSDGFVIPGSASKRGMRSVDEPSFTITSKMHRWGLIDGWEIAGHVTVQEAAILQGYPAAWGPTARPSPTLTSHLGVTRSPSGTQSIYRKAIESGDFIFKPVEPIASKIAKNGIGSEYAPNTINIDVNEGGILQSYPNGFPFQGTSSEQQLQVGNAVPPLVAKAVLETFL